MSSDQPEIFHQCTPCPWPGSAGCKPDLRGGPDANSRAVGFGKDPGAG